jgi:hypothetical protein
MTRYLIVLARKIRSYFHTIPFRVQIFFQYFISKEFYKLEIVQKLNSNRNKNLAIIVVYPRPEILNSVLRMIQSIQESGYSLLIVMNESSHSEVWLSSFENLDAEILLRPNIGRDFGGYKIGFLHAEKAGYLADCEKLIFANDSIYYGPRSIDFVKSMLDRKENWVSMFLNYEKHTHAQSFFLVFSSEIIRSECFINYWHKYYPSELREHNIDKGEVELSQGLLRSGFAPFPFVQAQTVLNSNRFENFTRDEIRGIWADHGHSHLDSSVCTLENTIHLMKMQYLFKNITHYQGLLVSRILGAPLKLDIFQTGLVTREGLVETLIELGVPKEELDRVVSSMTMKGTPATTRGLRKT